MQIPESIALQGIDTVIEYKKKQTELESLKEQIYHFAKEIEEIEKQIKKTLNEFHWNKPIAYYSDWKSSNTAKRHFTLAALTKRHEELSFQIIDLTNHYASLTLELYHKGWLPEWKMKEYRRLGFYLY
jgi:predicted  nucleic acid-binding Zn-ribbon protein